MAPIAAGSKVCRGVVSLETIRDMSGLRMSDSDAATMLAMARKCQHRVQCAAICRRQEKDAPCRTASDRLAIDIFGREPAVPERVALDAALLPLLAAVTHSLADAE